MDQQLIHFLEELKIYGIKKSIPNISEPEGYFLNMLVRISSARNILEIGCANGYSTIWLADAARKNGGRVSAIDFSRPSFDSAKENLVKAGLSGFVDFYFGNALEIIPTISNPREFDFIFVDGEKRSYWDFWNKFKGRLAANAIVIFDDALLFPEKTEQFIKNIENVVGFDQVILPIGRNGGVLLLFKT